MKSKKLIYALLALPFLLWGESPPILYLTWMHDPTSTMTIHWHGKERLSRVSYRQKGEGRWQDEGGSSHRVRKTDWYVHAVELVDLEPDEEYEFQIIGKEGFYRFSTLPKTLKEPLTFVVGGDVYHHFREMQQMHATIAKRNPAFVVVGGDIAYTHGKQTFFAWREDWEYHRWANFLRQWREQMVTSDGKLIPIMPLLGNHDVRGIALKGRHAEPLFYDLFALPEHRVSFRAVDFGDYLTLYLLDSGHNYHIQGAQKQWLAKSLAAHVGRPYQFAAYHVSAYPSVYSFTGVTPQMVRKEWCPLFDQYHLQIAFEHHNHAYKRTFPLTGDRLDPSGVVYVGDGSWGVKPRKPKDYWYLEEKARKSAVCLVTLSQEKTTVAALGSDGKIFDTFTSYPQGSREFDSSAQ
ncbi:MAG: metallophosphoesterase family protein [Verrucomicrobia bacterium]|nr:metallophosphoesterase family protein [Verrucomicrobiota bacterium]